MVEPNISNLLAQIESATKVEQAAEQAASEKKASGKKAEATGKPKKTETEMALGLKAQEAAIRTAKAEARAAKAEGNCKALWEVCKFVYATGTGTEIYNAEKALTTLIMHGTQLEAHLKVQKQKDGKDLIFGLRRSILDRQRMEDMRQKAKDAKDAKDAIALRK
jgi:hypothetical protein